MPGITITQLSLIIILVVTSILTSFSTDHNARAIRNQIAQGESQLALLKTKKGSRDSEVIETQKALVKLEKELSNVEQSSWFPAMPENGSLSAKIRSSLPYIVGITIGVVLGAVVIVLIPIIFVAALITLATFAGSSGLLLEFVRSEKRALTLSTIPAGLYALTQVFVILQLFDLFYLVFWVFDIVVVMTLIGVSIVFGKELQLEIVIIIVAILAAWDIFAVLLSPVMGLALSKFALTLPSVLIPTGNGYSLLGGGDFFFSYLLVTVLTRRLKKIPVALIVSICASVMGLIVVMSVVGLRIAPALPAVLIAGLLSVAYYRKELGKPSS
jgi:hypothetical protein